MTWALQLALEGRLDREMDRAQADFAAAVRQSVGEYGRQVLEQLRADVAGSGLANAGRLSKTWRMRLYPDQLSNGPQTTAQAFAGVRGRQRAVDAAAYLYSRAPVIQRAFEEGVTIRSSNGFFLAIPTEAAPQRDIGSRGSRRRLIEAAELRYGPLRFVSRPNGPSLLVADARQNSRGRFVRASDRVRRTGNQLATVVVFLLVPQARLKQRLDGAAIRDRADAAFESWFQRRLNVLLAEADARRAAARFGGRAR